MKLTPLTKLRWQRFRSIKRGYYSFIFFITMTLISFFAEFFINSRPLIVYYDGKITFPIVRQVLSNLAITHRLKGKDYGFEGQNYEPDYKLLTQKIKVRQKNEWVIFPFINFNPYDNDKIDTDRINKKINAINDKYNQIIANESNEDSRYQLLLQQRKETQQLEEEKNHPLPPNFSNGHYLGTDVSGRDILARLVYGYRISIIFALLLVFITYVVGIIIGCMMGYYGGWFDLIIQRLIEIWQSVPGLYVIIIITAVFGAGFFKLILISAVFGWMGATWYFRTITYREREKAYVLAARSLGASHWRIILNDILPNTISLVVTFIPFAISGSIIALTSLDFLGYGLPAPTPSWGELLKQGTDNLHSIWIVTSVVLLMSFVLFLVNLIGEAVREAYDPKKYSYYR